MTLFTGCHNLGAGLADENAVLRGTGSCHSIFAFFLDLLPSGKQCLWSKGAQCGKVGTACLGHHIFPEGIQLLHRLGGQHFADTAAAAHHGLGKQPLRQRGQAKLLHAHGAGALSHYGNIVSIAAKGADVGAHPLQCAQLVKQTIVAGVSGFLGKLVQAGKCQGPQPIVDGYRNAALGRPFGTVKVLFVSAAAGKTAAVDIENYRQLAVGRGIGGRPDVQKQAVLTVAVAFAAAELIIIKRLFRNLRFIVKGAGLVAAGTIFGCFVHAIPVGHGFGVAPARSGSVANALVGSDARPLAVGAGNVTARGVTQVFQFAHQLRTPFCCRRWASTGVFFRLPCCTAPACASGLLHGAYPWQ